MTASRTLMDLKRGEVRFILLGVNRPFFIKVIGITVIPIFRRVVKQALTLGTYVLCASAFTIALSAV